MKKSLLYWIMASRPKTLSASIAPVLMGSAMALHEHRFQWMPMMACLSCAILIQIGTNLANDYFDFKKGADTAKRKGPTRVTQAGLIPPEQVKQGFILSFVLAGLLGLYLIISGGLPILIIGSLSILSGILYTAGPKPLAYIGLGDLFVLFFFGPVALAGTYYVQTHLIDSTIIITGLAPGLLSTAILAINNLRDINEDREVGKKTLAVQWGETFAKFEILLCFIGAWTISLYLGIVQGHNGALVSLATVIPGLAIARSVFQKKDKLNETLARTGALLLMYALSFCMGWIFI